MRISSSLTYLPFLGLISFGTLTACNETPSGDDMEATDGEGETQRVETFINHKAEARVISKGCIVHNTNISISTTYHR